MASAHVMPDVVSAQQLEPGIQTPTAGRGMLPPTSEAVPVPSNVVAEFRTLDQMPDPRPSRVLFAGLRDPRLRMVQAIPLDVNVEDSNVVVYWQAIDEFGVGETLSGALDDFASTLRELYHRLMEVDELGPDIAEVKRVLGEYVVPR